jgi:hypothetical protein
VAKSSIAKLSVLLSANTAQFGRGMDSARKKTGLVAGAAKALTSRLGVLAGGAGFGLLVRQSFASVDALAKVSAKLGLTTEALAGLRRAAALSGVATNTLDMAIQRMTRRVGEAATGTGEAKAAIAELGLDAKALGELSPDQMFDRVARAMEGVDNKSQKLRLAFKLFDSEGVALVNTLALGSDGLRQAAQDAKRLGTAISADAARKVEDANDAISELADSAKGLGNTIAVNLAPNIEGSAKALTALAVAARPFVSVVTSTPVVLTAAGVATLLVTKYVTGLGVSLGASAVASVKAALATRAETKARQANALAALAEARAIGASNAARVGTFAAGSAGAITAQRVALRGFANELTAANAAAVTTSASIGTIAVGVTAAAGAAHQFYMWITKGANATIGGKIADAMYDFDRKYAQQNGTRSTEQAQRISMIEQQEKAESARRDAAIKANAEMHRKMEALRRQGFVDEVNRHNAYLDSFDGQRAAVQGIKEQFDDLGKSGRELWLEQLRTIQDVDNRSEDWANGLIGKFDKIESYNKRREAAENRIGKLRSRKDQIEAELNRDNNMSLTLAGAAERGTTAEYSARMSASRGFDRLVRIGERQADLMGELKYILYSIKLNTDDDGNVTVGIE